MVRPLAKWYRVFAVVLVAFGLNLTAITAHADEVGLSSYDVAAGIAADGTLSVDATLTFAGDPPASLQQVFDTTLRTAEATQYQFTITEITASSAGKLLNSKLTTTASSLTIDIPTEGVTEPVKLHYKVGGAAMASGDSTKVHWAFLQGLSLPVADFNAIVTPAAQFTSINCAAGNPADLGNCTAIIGGIAGQRLPVFSQVANSAGDMVLITLTFPSTQVAVNQNLQTLWTAERAFSVAPLPGGIGLAGLLLGAIGLWAGHRKIGRDFAGEVAPVLVADFHPVADGRSEFRVLDGVRPGEIGTLVDERVDPVDVTAAILDLAVRGHLRITELPRESVHGPSDWAFTRLEHDEDVLADYERTLLNAVAPVQGDPVKLSNLPGSLGSVIPQVQSELYDEVVAAGWFARRPDTTRGRWGFAGWVVLALSAIGAGLLIAFTSFGLLGLALIMLSLGLLAISGEMPARTASGTAVLRGLDVLRGNLLTHPVANVGVGEPYPQISKLLPYAVVLGGRERWVQAMTEADDDDLPDSTDLGWYHGPEDWHMADLPASLNNFITTIQGTLFSR
jgi:hypothetical protein